MIAFAVAAVSAATFAPIDQQNIFARVAPDSQRFSITVAFRGGSACDPQNLHGAHHLLEHALFLQRTEDRNSEPDWVAELYGCSLNATTYRELILFECEGPAANWKKGVEAMRLLLRPPTVSESAIRREMNVIWSEVSFPNRSASRCSSDLLWKASCSNQALARDTAGTLAEMRTATPKTILELYAREITKQNCFAAIVGPEDGSKVLTALLNELPSGEFIELPAFGEFKTGVSSQKTPGVCVAFPSPGLDALKEYASLLVTVELIRLLSPTELDDLEIAIGPSNKGALLTCISQSRVEKSLRSLLTKIASGEYQPQQVELARKIAINRFSLANSAPQSWSRSYAILRALGGSELDEALFKSLSTEQLKSAAAKLNPENGNWIQGQ